MKGWLGKPAAIRASLIGLTGAALLGAAMFALEYPRLGGVALAMAIAGIPGYLYLVARRVSIVLMGIRREVRDGLVMQAQLGRDVEDVQRYVAASESVLTGIIGESVHPISSEVQATVERSAREVRDAIAASMRTSGSEFLETSRRTATELMGVADSLAKIDSAVSDTKVQSRSLFNVLQGKLQGLRANIEELPQSAGEYQALRTRLVTTDDELPMLGGWALTSPTVTALARRILTHSEPLSVVELGSGASTVWMAMALRERGAGHCTTVEHLPGYADSVRADLQRRGLTQWVTVIDAPLVDTFVDGDRFLWYDQRAFPQGLEIDILLVDGPPAGVSELARFPALPILATQLNDKAWVVLDDTIRVDEKRIAALWEEREIGGMRLDGPRSTGKSFIYEVVRT